MLCANCKEPIRQDEHMRDNFHDSCLGEFQEKIYQLLGFHPDTDPSFIYNEILRLREIARKEK